MWVGAWLCARGWRPCPCPPSYHVEVLLECWSRANDTTPTTHHAAVSIMNRFEETLKTSWDLSIKEDSRKYLITRGSPHAASDDRYTRVVQLHALGPIISDDAGCREDRRIARGKMWKAFFGTCSGKAARGLPIAAKTKLLNKVVGPILDYHYSRSSATQNLFFEVDRVQRRMMAILLGLRTSRPSRARELTVSRPANLVGPAEVSFQASYRPETVPRSSVHASVGIQQFKTWRTSPLGKARQNTHAPSAASRSTSPPTPSPCCFPACAAARRGPRARRGGLRSGGAAHRGGGRLGLGPRQARGAGEVRGLFRGVSRAPCAEPFRRAPSRPSHRTAPRSQGGDAQRLPLVR